jgi:hypothetical protein
MVAVIVVGVIVSVAVAVDDCAHIGSFISGVL